MTDSERARNLQIIERIRERQLSFEQVLERLRPDVEPRPRMVSATPRTRHPLDVEEILGGEA